MNQNIVYGHFDVEADGPTPTTGNMINMGIIFTDPSGKILEEVSVDIQPRPEFNPDPDTLKWWRADSKRSDEYDRILKYGLSLEDAMNKIDIVIKKVLKEQKVKRIIWVARPASYDWQFFKGYWELYRLKNSTASDIGFSATCLSTMREIWLLFSGIDKAQIEKYFEKWTQDLVMTHNGLDDARYQSRIFHGIQEELKNFSLNKSK